ncbi:alpha/beta hydrolase [Fertoebacter nigrum]|uniref:Alpha/beta hydrolase n=1 Tax=Fertoeibacter niger TaxID=2656921 RepID=A0A8X8H4N8_9RHOB|nr:alpha/beta hydrolase [Fertoeibacter niger]NUB45563.1 alpha/beta hydrolase [Fertoeibacter niger]
MDPYRNRDFIPDFDAILAETAARSRELASRVEMRADVAYGPSPRQRIDILFPPHRTKDAPLHMFIHGGYWRSGCRADHHLVAAPVLAAGGIAAIASYDLMPGTRLGQIVAQVRAAARHLLAIAPDLGADPARFTASGHSAGAHLASYLAAHGPEERMRPELPVLRGILMVSGIYDLSGIPASFLKDEARMSVAEAEAWSPLTSPQSALPMRIVTRGAHETAPFHDQASAFASVIDAAGQTCKLRVEPDLNHMTIVLALADPASALGGVLGALSAD